MRNGGPPTTPARRAVEHVERLLADHPTLTRNHIATLAGITRGTLYRIEVPDARLTRVSEELILAVRDEHVLLLPPRHVPKAPVIAHIDRLLCSDPHVSLNTIAKASGMSYQTLYNIKGGRSATVEWRTHAAIMAVTPETALAKVHYRPLAPTRTRIRALQANGWSMPALDAIFGRMLADCITDPTRTTVSAQTEAEVKAVYERIGDTIGPSRKAMTMARRAGYMPPIYYDEDMNLIEVEEETEEERAQHAARADLCILGLTLDGRNVAHIKQALGVNERTISSARRRGGIAVARNFSGEQVAEERVPGAIEAIRNALRGVHLSSLDVLDEPGLDYEALWREVEGVGVEQTAA